MHALALAHAHARALALAVAVAVALALALALALAVALALALAPSLPRSLAPSLPPSLARSLCHRVCFWSAQCFSCSRSLSQMPKGSSSVSSVSSRKVLLFDQKECFTLEMGQSDTRIIFNPKPCMQQHS